MAPQTLWYAGLDLDISAPIFDLQQNASIQTHLLDPIAKLPSF
jgi:hypothetical protein